MKIFIIGHADAVRGFALAGVPGEIVTTAAALCHALDQALADADIGIILITEDVAELARERVSHIKMHSAIPLLIEIPGPDGPLPDQPGIHEMIRQRTGIKL